MVAMHNSYDWWLNFRIYNPLSTRTAGFLLTTIQRTIIRITQRPNGANKMTTINQGRYAARIHKNGADDFLVIVTRDGDCLNGIPSRSYSTAKKADTGARKMLAKASAWRFVQRSTRAHRTCFSLHPWSIARPTLSSDVCDLSFAETSSDRSAWSNSDSRSPDQRNL